MYILASVQYDYPRYEWHCQRSCPDTRWLRGMVLMRLWLLCSFPNICNHRRAERSPRRNMPLPLSHVRRHVMSPSLIDVIVLAPFNVPLPATVVQAGIRLLGRLVSVDIAKNARAEVAQSDFSPISRVAFTRASRVTAWIEPEYPLKSRSASSTSLHWMWRPCAHARLPVAHGTHEVAITSSTALQFHQNLIGHRMRSSVCFKVVRRYHLWFIP